MFGQRIDLDPALVEKAAKALYEHRQDALTCYDHLPDGHSVWRWCCICGEHDIRVGHREHVARAVLEAVADDLRADAWDEGRAKYAAAWDDGYQAASDDWCTPGVFGRVSRNPYRQISPKEEQ